MKKNGWKKRGLALLLSVSMLISVVPVTVSAEETLGEPSQAVDAGIVEEKEPVRIVAEVPELRGPDEKHFRLSDGSMAAAKYPDAVHYATEEGWAEIDNSLALEKTAEPVYSNQENAFKVSFAESADAEELVRLEQDGYALSWSYAETESEQPALTPFTAAIPKMVPAKAQVMEKEELTAEETAEVSANAAVENAQDTAAEDTESGVLPADDPALQVEKASSGIVYENIQPGVDLQYILTGSQLKENLILEQPMDTYAFTLHLQAEGLIAALEEDGSISFTPDAGGEAVFTIPAPVLYDSAGAVSDKAAYSLAETETGYDLTVTADESWMDAPERAYPVTIDPVVLTRRQDAAISCAFAQSGSPNTNAGGYGSIEVGRSSLASIGNQRGFVKIEMPSIPGNANVIVGAYLTLYQFSGSYYDYSGTPTPRVDLYKVTSSWTQSGLTWNNQPSVESRVTDYNMMERIDRTNADSVKNLQKDKRWNITRLAKEWYETPSSNYGVMLKASNENASAANTAFAIYCMPNHPQAVKSVYPGLVVQYLNNLGLEEYWTYHSGSVGSNASYSINDFTGNLVVFSDDITIPGNRMPYTIYHVYNSGSASENIGYGKGWRLNICQTVTDLQNSTAADKELYQNGYSYRYVDEDGTELYFKKSDSKDETGKGLTIKKSGSNYIITDKKDNALTFNASGRLTKITDSNGNSMQITCNSAGQPTEVTTATGETVLLNYTAVGGLLADIQAFSLSQSVRYDYTSGNLLSLSDRSDTNDVGYRYTSDRLNGLQENRSAVAAVFTYTSTTGKRISSVQEYGGTSFSLDASRAGVISGLTTANLGQEMRIEYGNYETFFYTSGEDDVIDNGDDIKDTYQFDNAGKTTCVISATRDGSEQFGATNTVYGSKDSDKNRVTSSAQVSKTSLNLLKDSSFERGKNEWQNLGSTTGVTRTRTTAAELYGYYSGKVTVSSTNTGIDGYTQQITGLTPGKHYVLSGYVKASGVTGRGAALQVLAVGTGGFHKYLSNCETGTTSSEVNGGWRRLWVDFEVPAGTYAVTVNIGIAEGKGTAYFDGIQLEEGTVPSAYNLMDNPSFERGDLADLHGWVAIPSVSSSNTLANTAHSGSRGYMIKGTPTSTPCIRQTVPVNCDNKSVFKVSGWMKAEALPVKDVENEGQRELNLQICINYVGGATKWYNFPFNPYVSGWQYVSGIIDCDNGTSSRVDNIQVHGVYYRMANTAYFDDFQLIKDEASSYTYDKDGNLISAKQNAEQQTQREYDDNDLTKLTDAKGNVYTYEYDSKHRVTEATSQRNVVNSFTYDSYGNMKTSVVSGSGTTQKINTSAVYTSDGNHLSKVTDAAGNQTKYTYDAISGQLIKVVDALGNSVRYQYNIQSHLPTQVSSHVDNASTISNKVEYIYDDNWRLDMVRRSYTDYMFDYDIFGNLLKTRVGSRTLSTNTYNARNGKLTDEAYGNGSKIHIAYDSLDRAVSRTVNGTEWYRWAYDGEGNIGELEDLHNDVTYRYEYDTTGRLQRETLSDGSELFYGYDLNNNVTKAVYTAAGETRTNTFTFGKDNLLEKSALAGGVTVTYAYDGLNRLQYRLGKVGSGSVEMEYIYRPGNGTNGTTTQVARENLYRNGTLSEIFDYEYDEMGNITEMTENGVGRYTYTYDAIGQLVRVDDTYGRITTVYKYDEDGNILEKTEYPLNNVTGTGEVTKYTYGDITWGDLLTAYDGKSISYDSIGNPTTYYNGSRMRWIGRQLDTLIYADGNSCMYDYNADGIRVKKVINGKETHKYLLEGDRIIREEILDKNGVRKHLLWYNYDGNGQLASVEYDGTKYLYKVNQMGDVLGLYNTTGTQVVRYRYDAWGKLLEIENSSGQTITNAENIGMRNPFRYRGYYYDTDTGFYYLNARYYDPETGRFLNADGYASTGQGFVGSNMFAYCNNNPVMNADYTGSMPCGADICFYPDLWSHSIDTCRMLSAQAKQENSGGIIGEAEHKKNARNSTKNKHEEGQSRKQRDKGGEKGDARRRPNPNKRKPSQSVTIQAGDIAIIATGVILVGVLLADDVTVVGVADDVVAVAIAAAVGVVVWDKLSQVPVA